MQISVCAAEFVLGFKEVHGGATIGVLFWYVWCQDEKLETHCSLAGAFSAVCHMLYSFITPHRYKHHKVDFQWWIYIRHIT